MKKTQRFAIRATDEQKELARKLAEKKGVTMSDLIHDLVKRSAARSGVKTNA